MRNIATILGLLFGGFAVALLCGAKHSRAGVVGISAVFAATALGHFVKRDQMAAMLPANIPARSAMVTLSGLLELALALGVLFSPTAKAAGLAICGFLVLVTPLNIYSALNRVDFGGHAHGPAYLMVRLPLQFLLIVWTFWSAVRPG
jgi:uncharacterized membrane protein